MKGMLQVLIVQDNRTDGALIAQELRRSGIDAQCTRVQDEQHFREQLENCTDVILVDNGMTNPDPLRALAIARECGADVPLIVLCTKSSEETAIRTLKHGAADYVLKDHLARLGHAIENAVAQQRLRTARHTNDDQPSPQEKAIAAFSHGVTIADARMPENPITFVNPGFEQMTGYRHDEAIGRHFSFLCGVRTDSQTVGQLREAIDAGRPIAVEILNYRKDGTPFWNALTISPIRDESGAVTHFVGVHTDISERKRHEGVNQQAQKMEAIGRLAGGVAHDFNNLLTVILGCSDLVLTALPQDSPVRELTQQIKQAGERGASLTRQLLAFSRKQRFQASLVYVNDIINDFSKMLRRLIGEDIEYVTVLNPTLGLVKADPAQLEQVLLNLVVNARDAMPDGGRVNIETRNTYLDERAVRDRPEMRAGDYVMIEVRDTGCGMSPDVMAHMYEPFFTTKDPGKGTGLGLAMAYGIVKQSNGYIYAESQPGKGTTFQLYFPLVRSTETVQPDLAVQQPLPRGKETILLVEDEETVRRLNRLVLQGKGYTVLEACDGQEAAKICEQFNGAIHLMVTDVIMPKMNCRDLVKRVGSLRPATKVLYVSGYSSDVLADQGLADATFPILQKPFSPAVLMRKIREVLKN